MVRDSPPCRVCEKKSKDAISLDTYYSKKSNLTFLDCFNISTHLNASLDDGLPSSLCTQCRDSLKSSYKFLEKAKEADRRLREKYGELLPQPQSDKIKEEFFEHSETIEESIAEIKTEFISCARDPLEDSELEDDDKSKSTDELEIRHGIEADNNLESEDDVRDVFDARDDTDDDDEDFNRPLTELIKKENRKQPGTSTENMDDGVSKLLDTDIESQIEEAPRAPPTIENAIFPIGRYVCKICKKTYFTEAGLKFHINVHLPKQRRIKVRSDKGKKRKEKRKKKTTENGDGDDEFFDNDAEKKTGSDIPGEDNIADRSKEPAAGPGKKKRKEKIPKPKKTFPCHVCGRHMISASKLRYHMVMHTGEKDYLCTQCPKAYSTIYALKHHMRTHTGERPYECKFCGDRFTRPTTLKSHMRRHTGERPYGCDICGKRFIQHSSMTTHMKLNHMAKNIECPHCDKKYARQTDLNTHLLSHTGDKPFSCQLCPSRFIRQANLNKHMNIHHSGAKASKEAKPSAVYVAAAAAFATAAAGVNKAPMNNTDNPNTFSSNNMVAVGPSSNSSSTSNHTIPPPALIPTASINRINTQSCPDLHHSHIPQHLESVDHLKSIHPPVDNLTNLLGQVIEQDRPPRTVDDIMRWGWPNNS